MTSLVLGGDISVLNNHVINVVIPNMMSGLGTDVITIRWGVTAYMLANAVMIPLTSWLARVLGTRQLYVYSRVLFIASAVVCGMANSVSALIVFRVIQGIGGGIIMPVTMLLMLDIFPAEKRGLGTAVWGMGVSCGSLTGIPLGGALPASLHAKVLLGRLISHEARLLAFNDSFILFIAICLVGMALTVFFRRAQSPTP